MNLNIIFFIILICSTNLVLGQSKFTLIYKHTYDNFSGMVWHEVDTIWGNPKKLSTETIDWSSGNRNLSSTNTIYFNNGLETNSIYNSYRTIYKNGKSNQPNSKVPIPKVIESVAIKDTVICVVKKDTLTYYKYSFDEKKVERKKLIYVESKLRLYEASHIKHGVSFDEVLTLTYAPMFQTKFDVLGRELMHIAYDDSGNILRKETKQYKTKWSIPNEERVEEFHINECNLMSRIIDNETGVTVKQETRNCQNQLVSTYQTELNENGKIYRQKAWDETSKKINVDITFEYEDLGANVNVIKFTCNHQMYIPHYHWHKNEQYSKIWGLEQSNDYLKIPSELLSLGKEKEFAEYIKQMNIITTESYVEKVFKDKNNRIIQIECYGLSNKERFEPGSKSRYNELYPIDRIITFSYDTLGNIINSKIYAGSGDISFTKGTKPLNVLSFTLNIELKFKNKKAIEQVSNSSKIIYKYDDKGNLTRKAEYTFDVDTQKFILTRELLNKITYE